MANKRDYAAGIVSVPPSPATSGTSITLQAGEGAFMPPVPFNATLAPTGVLTNLASSEKVLVTARPGNGDTFTIVRAQGETTAKSVAQGWIFANTLFTEDMSGGGIVVQDEPPSDTDMLWYDTNDNSAPVSNGAADTVDGFHASSTPTPNTIPVLDSNGKLPESTNGTVHSTSEVDTGKKWTDGRAIYRRTFIGTITQAANSRNTTNLIASGVALIVNSYGEWRESTSVAVSLNSVRLGATGVADGYSSLLNVDGSLNLYTWSTTARTSMSYNVTVEYIKV